MALVSMFSCSIASFTLHSLLSRPSVNFPSNKRYLFNAESVEDQPKFFIVVNNLQSGSNIGSICRNALAFNAHEVITVGRKGLPSMHHADKGSRFKVKFTHFPTTKEASVYLKETHNCTVFGVEITADSTPVTKQPFRRSSAFVFGNEGGGLSKGQREICDQYIYIPQYSTGMASINVACASAIIMHNFAVWAMFSESEIVGEKFL